MYTYACICLYINTCAHICTYTHMHAYMKAIFDARACQGLLETRLCDKFVKEFAIWHARGCQGLLEARLGDKFVNEFAIWDASGSWKLGFVIDF